MHTYKIKNRISGTVLGEWEAPSENAALNKMARAEGYRSYRQLRADVSAHPSEIVVIKKAKENPFLAHFFSRL